MDEQVPVLVVGGSLVGTGARFDMRSDEFRADPYPQYAELLAQAPVHPVAGPFGTTNWLILGYEEARSVLNDTTFSKHPRHAPQWLRDLGLVTEDGGPTGANMLNSDPPVHTRLRRMVTKGFTNRRVQELRPRVQEITDDLLNAMAPLGQVDLIDAFAYPLPITVISELIGVPQQDRDDFRAWTAAMLLSPLDPARRIERDEGIHSMHQYLTELAQRKRRESSAGLSGDDQPDLLSALVSTADDDEGRLSQRELIGILTLLLVAGHETTVNLIGNGMLALLTHPDQLERVREEVGLLPAAIEEMLRFDGPVEHGTLRVATEPVEIGGVTIPAGAQVTVVLGSANRDRKRFLEPDGFKVDRRENAHLSFGYGLHFCLGAPLARLEAQIAFASLLSRFPDLTLACPAAKLRQRPSTANIFRGLEALPVRFAAAA